MHRHTFVFPLEILFSLLFIVVQFRICLTIQLFVYKINSYIPSPAVFVPLGDFHVFGLCYQSCMNLHSFLFAKPLSAYLR